MVKLIHLVGKCGSGTTGFAAMLAAQFGRGGGVIGVITAHPQHEIFFRAYFTRLLNHQVISAQPIIALRNSDDQLLNEDKEDTWNTLSCIVLDMVAVCLASYPQSILLPQVLEVSRHKTNIVAVIVCVGHPMDVAHPPEWLPSDDWQVKVFSDYCLSPVVSRWMRTLNNTNPPQLDAMVHGPGSTNFMEAHSMFPMSQTSSKQTSSMVTFPKANTDNVHRQSRLEDPKHS